MMTIKLASKNKYAKNGISLIEILFALVILSSVFISLFQILRSGVKGTERLSEESYAANHAISLLESVSALTYSQIPQIPEGTADEDIMSWFAGIPEFSLSSLPDSDFPRTIKIKEVSKRTKDDSDSDNSQWGSLKVVSVTISWHPIYLKKHVKKSKSFHALITDDMEVSR